VKILITGAGGMLAHACTERARSRGHDVMPYDRAALDVTDAHAVHTTILQAQPDAVLQCAAYTRVDAAEDDEIAAHEVNARATALVSKACAEAGARLVYPSTDYVFDGRSAQPYLPNAQTGPLNAYGRTKLAGEVQAAHADALIVRTSWLYGPHGRNFVRTIITRARAGEPLRVVNDQRGAPTFTFDLADAILRLLEQQAPPGIFHVTNSGDTTWYELALAATVAAGVHTDIAPVSASELPTPARRPAYSVLDCTATEGFTGALPHWRDALERAVHAGLA
jgi:dTDP-4-dehydrorhamnose reductase